MDLDIDFEIDYSSKEDIKNNIPAEKSIIVDDSSFIKIRHEIKSQDVNYLIAYELAKKLDIKKGESIFIKLDGRFIFGDFIGAFIQENNLAVEELSIESLSGGIDVFEMFEALIDQGWVKKINLTLSEYYLRTERAKRSKSIELLEEIKKRKKNKFNLYYTNTHRKIVLIRTKLGGYVVMHGSANLKSSQSREQLFIQENKELYDFNYQEYINISKSIKNG